MFEIICRCQHCTAVRYWTCSEHVRHGMMGSYEIVLVTRQQEMAGLATWYDGLQGPFIYTLAEHVGLSEAGQPLPVPSLTWQWTLATSIECQGIVAGIAARSNLAQFESVR